MYRIVPYKIASASAKLLAEKLTEISGKKVISGAPSYDHKNILWGNSNIPLENLQPAKAVAIAQNKLKTFNKLRETGVKIPEFTTSKQVAEDWVRSGITVLARQKLNAAEGRGIVVCKQLPLANAPLYVKLVKKNKEFRVHVFNGEVIDIQEKRRRSGVRDENGKRPNGMIRNISNEWVFCRKNIVEPAGLKDMAIKAVQDIGLLFGAVDIIYHARTNDLNVLEINTAPGLCQSTATKYANAILKI